MVDTELLNNILLILAIIMASFAVMLAFMVMYSFLRRLIKIPTLRLPRIRLPKRNKIEIKPKRRTEYMSNEKDVAKEAVTFNDIFMFLIAVPLVLLWVGFAGFVIHTGLNNAAVLENIEAYTTLIAILGGPALLIIKDALDVWKQEQAEKTAFYKIKAQSVIDYNNQAQKQAQDIESKAQAQAHMIETGITLPKKK